MIRFDSLPHAINAAHAHELRELAANPTSRACVGVLATRCGLRVINHYPNPSFELFVVEDAMIPSPLTGGRLAIVCLDGNGDVAPSLLGDQIHVEVNRHGLARSPALFITDGPMTALTPHLTYSDMVYETLDPGGLTTLLTGSPPRKCLVDILTAQASLRSLNPFVFQGPVGKHLFVGRQAELRRLTSPEASYAMVGPRSIGKSSLLNMAFDDLREHGHVVIRVEFGSALTEHELLLQMADAFIQDYDAWPGLVQSRRLNAERFRRLVKQMSHKSESKKVAIIIDEADGLEERCPELVDILRALHDEGTARFILAGYKQLRRAISNARQSPLMNLVQPIRLTSITHKDCGALLVRPTVPLGIHIEDISHVVDEIFIASGGAPARIQLLCHAMLNQLDHWNSREITPSFAAAAIQLPEVTTELRTWYHSSTTLLEQFVAALGSEILPCSPADLCKVVADQLSWATRQDVESEIDDLVLANVLDHRPNGLLDFSFPAARELALPMGQGPTRQRDLRRMKSQLRRRS